ncbi:GNAT family N-acetyltransferase [Lentibacillus amyloliquefaciens]|uniref:GNAT family acetyltransferase n=1 Tax=Lentibacillus amyloliquefaciens TaxID=1472767 RepID=A0A0U3W2W4_9BACI|nr:GNAT family N-acetyltransferase [Lentibacillus amyloliquefaciens]ALX47504.1 GNAT family acetyltransferase [Lentibacillus amyloliquefaciens]
MIRRLTKNDEESCFKLLQTKPAENLFIIGDIEAYGYEQEFQKLWGEWNEDGELIAVLLKYDHNYIPFAIADFDALRFAQIMEDDPQFKMISGLKEITEKIVPHLQKYSRKRKMYYAKCSEITGEWKGISYVEEAIPEDAEEIVNFLNAVPEFDNSPSITEEQERRGLEQGASRTFYIKIGDKIVSTASTTAENTMSAMIVGVATLQGYKQKGYATACMIRLCEKLLSEGKELCLFYDNPEAGAIYKRIGFKDIGFWMLYTYS